MIGSKLRCNKKKVDAELYYQDKYEKVLKEWNELKTKQTVENAGVTFVSFRDKSCVIETIDEIDILKTRVVGIEKYDKLKLVNWEIDEAIPTTDIIWQELNKSKSLPFVIRFFLSKILPLVVVILVIYGIIHFDRNISPTMDPNYGLALKYLCPLIIGALSFYFMPKLLFNISIQAERHERKS